MCSIYGCSGDPVVRVVTEDFEDVVHTFLFCSYHRNGSALRDYSVKDVLSVEIIKNVTDCDLCGNKTAKYLLLVMCACGNMDRVISCPSCSNGNAESLCHGKTLCTRVEKQDLVLF